VTSDPRAIESIPVAVADTGARSYPVEPPFDPPEHYPELPDLLHLDPTNKVYAGVREALRLLGLDLARHGTPLWNPLGDIIRPGDRVVVKPNLVRHFHGDGLGLDALVAHGSVVRAVLDYVLIALKGKGSVTVGDSPLQYASFGDTLERSGVGRAVEEARRHTAVSVRVVDFRKERSEKRGGVIVARIPNEGDPEGYRVVDLKARSLFKDVPLERARRFRVTQYDPRTMRQAHNDATHAYLMPISVLKADVFINIPKLKTHQKAGITGAMKNLVGINGSKDWLPHHTVGDKGAGGDEYLHPSLRKRVVSILRDKIEGRSGGTSRRALHFLERAVKATGRLVAFQDPHWEGSWHGNDTVWRMVHDLHRILFYVDATGALRETPQRRYLAIVDAVIAGEGEGPMRPSPRPAGLIVAGANPAAVDIVCCRLMGFDERKIPLLARAIGGEMHPAVPSIESIKVASNSGRWGHPFDLLRSQTLSFAPPAGWAGAVELDR
jgi:uncharacterized protein (DUF362 family)